MQIRIRQSGQVMYEEAFRQHIQQSGGPSWGQTTTDILNELGADVVFDGPYPQHTIYQNVSSAPPVETDGQWYTAYTVTDMTQEEIDQVNAGLTASNKDKAQQLLTETDWVEIPSVTNTANTPHLTNGADFLTYRNALRAIAVNPTYNATFPTIPTEQWS